MEKTVHDDKDIKITIIGKEIDSILNYAIKQWFTVFTMMLILILGYLFLESIIFHYDTTIINIADIVVYFSIGLFIVFGFYFLVYDSFYQIFNIYLNRKISLSFDFDLILTFKISGKFSKLVNSTSINGTKLEYLTHLGSQKVEEGSKYRPNIANINDIKLKIPDTNVISIGHKSCSFFLSYEINSSTSKFYPSAMELVVKSKSVVKDI